MDCTGTSFKIDYDTAEGITVDVIKYHIILAVELDRHYRSSETFDDDFSDNYDTLLNLKRTLAYFVSADAMETFNKELYASFGAGT